ncbi:hypothetical protein ACM46_19240 [Chryseobacterium angstadtii]|uniref:Uncharacterized protein n=1 Tax=Chryseobacterium angstadtii TaxID=558151 RepID=A0A0J7KPT2_9FLAO|nr:hypothetical protein ACM46_19240 [Chryseobacterium angstadtii]
MRIQKLKLKDNQDLPLFLNYITHNKFKKIDHNNEGKKFYTKNEKLNFNNYYYATEYPISTIIDFSFIKNDE